MAWQRNYVTLTSGDRIRYSLIQRPGSNVYLVRFKSQDGKWLERSTGAVKKSDAVEAAHRKILEEYQHVAPTSETVTWEVAQDRLRAAMEADGKRPRTIQGYLETLRQLASMFPLARGPVDVTDRMAGDFKTKYAAGQVKGSKKAAEGKTEAPAPARRRKLKSLDSRVRTLKAVFGWFKQLRLVDDNPFEKVALPELDRHDVKYVRQDDITHFFAWLEERYPEWAMPRLFFQAKALSASRLDDLCNIRSSQLQDGRIVFTADTTKNRSERYVKLPKDTYAELDAYKGAEWLWEKYPPELKEATAKNGAPVHRLNPAFSPRRLYLWVVALMQDYQKQTGRKLSSHDFRRAAFTRAAEQDIHPKRAATAFDVTPETMMRYYTATDKKRTADEVLGGLADLLLPKPEGEAGGK
jgi:integrase